MDEGGWLSRGGKREEERQGEGRRESEGWTEDHGTKQGDYTSLV